MFPLIRRLLSYAPVGNFEVDDVVHYGEWSVVKSILSKNKWWCGVVMITVWNVGKVYCSYWSMYFIDYRTTLWWRNIGEYKFVSINYVKMVFTLEQAMKTQRGTRVIVLIFLLTSVLNRGGLSTPRHDRFTPQRDTQYTLYRMLGARGGLDWKSRPPPGFYPCTV
jgi:hypothetical protein